MLIKITTAQVCWKNYNAILTQGAKTRPGAKVTAPAPVKYPGSGSETLQNTEKIFTRLRLTLDDAFL